MAKKKREKLVVETQQETMPMEELVQERVKYPRCFPLAALETITRIARENSWAQSRVELCHCLWEMTGAGMRIFVGSPFATTIEAAPIDPEMLAARLHEVRELAYKGIMSLRGPALPMMPGTGAEIASHAVGQQEMRACLFFLENIVSQLAWLRRAANEAAINQVR